MRPLFAAAIVFCSALPAGALPLVALPLHEGADDARPGIVRVENRFLPRIFGGGGDNREQRAADDTLRVQQLEEQVRSLTGQVEELSFTVRRLEDLLRQPAAAAGGLPRADARASPSVGPGTPPRALGTLGAGDVSGSGAGSPTSRQPSDIASARDGGGGSGLTSEPLDLSALNRGYDPASADPVATAEPTAPAGTRRAGGSPALDAVRDLQASGRYSLAADAARALLTASPNGAVAGEARYLLGEALLAQRDFRGAANSFLENYTADPNGVRAPISLVRLGTALNGLGENVAACSSLEELFGAYPDMAPDIRAEAERERRAGNCA